jgi:methionine synthase II (cobalamin-independent)
VLHSYFHYTLYRKLDNNHKRILGIRLKLIEKHLRDTISILEHKGNATFELYSIRDNIDLEDKIKIIDIINSMLDEIRQIKKKFVLETDEETIRSHVLGHLNDVWTILEDSTPDNMRGYSRISELDNELLSPHILKLHNTLEDIARRYP